MVYNSEKNNIKSYRSANPHSLHESENFILPKIPYFIPKANNQFNCSKENLDFGGRYRILFHLTSTSQKSQFNGPIWNQNHMLGPKLFPCWLSKKHIYMP